MLPGFNTNLRHRGVLFHVQSEDSGRDHPHVITHLYHGGTILHSEKSSYADHVGVSDADLAEVARDLMERQHKAVLKRLRSRGYDAVIAERLGPSVFKDGTDSRAETRPSRTAPAVSAGADAPTEPPSASRAVDDPTQPSAGARSFGDGIVSGKPLDEVILNYLVENARKRKQKRS